MTPEGPRFVVPTFYGESMVSLLMREYRYGEGNRKEPEMAKGTFEVEVVRKDKDGDVTEQLLPITPVYKCDGAAAANFKAIETVVINRASKRADFDWTGVCVHVRPFCGQ